MQKYLQMLDELLNKIPHNIQDMIYKAGIGIGFVAVLWGIYVGLKAGQKAAQPQGLQMAKDMKDLFSDETKRSFQKKFNYEQSKKNNREYLDDSQIIKPKFYYKNKTDASPSAELDILKFKKKGARRGDIVDFDSLQPYENSNSLYLNDEKTLRQEYSNRLLRRETGLEQDYNSMNEVNSLPYEPQSQINEDPTKTKIGPKGNLNKLQSMGKSTKKDAPLKKFKSSGSPQKKKIKGKIKGKFLYTGDAAKPLSLD